MNQKGLVNIFLVILVIIIAGTVGYFAINQKIPTPAQTPSPSPIPSPTLSPSSTPTPTPSPSPTPKSKTDDILSVALGEEFTLKKNQVAKIGNTGLKIKITEFYNSPCPTGVYCIWSGVGIGFEYHFQGETQKGVDLLQSFGYQTMIVKTDHKTYATLIVEKMEPESR